jgi:predicted lactoylglutathione lyase
MRQKINLITLGTDDLEKSVAFYEGLGWKKSPASIGDLVLFPLGGITLALYPRKELAEDAQLPVSPRTEFSGVTLSYCAKSEAEVDNVLREAAALGATILKPAQHVFWGGYSGYFRDPAGHAIEVAYIPFWEMDENDNVKL